MGRPRKHRRDLPERVTHSHGAYYYIKPDGKWLRLDSDYSKAMLKWVEFIQAPVGNAFSTVNELLDKYILEVVPTKAERTQKDNLQEIRFLRAFFGAMLCRDVRTSHIAQYISARKAKTRANREIALLSHAFNKAILWEIATTNPCSVPGIRNSEKARDRYVTDEELELFKSFCDEWLQVYVDVKNITALRQQDLLALRWTDITPDGLKSLTKKTGHRLRIELIPELTELLNRLPRHGAYCFSKRDGEAMTHSGFGSIWRRRMAKFVAAGNERFTEHDIRGKVATDMDDPKAAQELLGHASIKMTESYIKQRKTHSVKPLSRTKPSGETR